MKLIAVLEQFAHHNLQTSPDNMVNYINYDAVIGPNKRIYADNIGDKVNNRIDFFLRKAVVMAVYDLASLKSEIKIFKSIY